MAGGTYNYYFELPKHLWKQDTPIPRSTALGADEYKAQEKALALYNKLRDWRAGKPDHDRKSAAYIWEEYVKHRLYTKLKARTKKDYNYARAFLSVITNSGKPIDGIPLDLYTCNLAEALYYDAFNSYKERTALKIMALLRLLYNFGTSRMEPPAFIGANPFANLRIEKSAPKRITYSRKNMAAVIAAAKAQDDDNGFALGLELNYYICQRPDDLVHLHSDNLEEDEDGNLFFSIIQRKTDKRVILAVPPHLAAQVRNRRGYIVLTKWGRPFTVDGFQRRFRAICEGIGLYGYESHRIRNTGATTLAEAGASDQLIMAQGGWSNINTFNNVYRGNTRELALQALRTRLRALDSISTLPANPLNSEVAN